jgi:sterol 3beta-glucosyltransferase/vancomycin aglycone glucosyltransferase
MTFGSMMVGEAQPATVIRILVDAALAAECRAIIQADWARAAEIPEHPAIYRLDRAPHAALFPRCAAVVHHGGAGTSHAAALAGKPSVIVAHATDQLFWAATLRRLGLAGAPLRRHALTAKRLARAIRLLLDSPKMQNNAACVGAAMQHEDGVQNAVAHIAEVGAG